MFPIIRCQKQLPNEFQQPESLCEATRHHNSIKLLILLPIRAIQFGPIQYDTPCMYYICRRSAFCVINVFNQIWGKTKMNCQQSSIFIKFFSVSWEMAPIAQRRCFICNVPEKSKVKILLKSHDIFFLPSNATLRQKTLTEHPKD